MQPIRLTPSTGLSDVVAAAPRDRKEGQRVVHLLGGALQVCESQPAMKKEKRQRFRKALTTLVMNEIDRCDRLKGKPAAQKEGIARDAMKGVLIGEGDRLLPVTIDKLRQLAEAVRQLDRVPPAEDAMRPSDLAAALPADLAAQAMTPALAPRRPTQPVADSGTGVDPKRGAAVPDKDPSLRRLQEDCRDVIQRHLRLQPVLRGEAHACVSAMRSDPRCSDLAVEAVMEHVKETEEAGLRLEGDHLANLARALLVIPVGDLERIGLNRKTFEKVKGFLANVFPSEMGDGSASAARKLEHRPGGRDQIRARLKSRLLESQFRDLAAQMRTEFESLGIESPWQALVQLERNVRRREQSSIDSKSMRKSDQKSPNVVHGDPAGRGASHRTDLAPILAWVGELERQAEARERSIGASRTRLHAEVDETLSQHLTFDMPDRAWAAGVRARQEARMSHLIQRIEGGEPEIVGIVVEHLELHIDAILAGAFKDQPDDAMYLKAVLLMRHIPAGAWQHVYFPRDVVDMLARIHAQRPEARRRFPMFEAGLVTLRRNADRFERFLETELAHDDRFDGVDRSILIALSEEADRQDESEGAPIPNDGGQDGRSAAEPTVPAAPPLAASGSDGEASRASARPDDGKADSGTKEVEVPLQGPRPSGGDPAGDAQPVGSDIVRSPPAGRGGQSLEPRLPLERWDQGAPPARAKRHTSHHDGSKAKWRSKRQRDLIGRPGKLASHVQAVRALRAARRQSMRGPQ